MDAPLALEAELLQELEAAEHHTAKARGLVMQIMMAAGSRYTERHNANQHNTASLGTPCAADVAWDEVEDDQPVEISLATHAVVIPDPELRDEPPSRPA